MSQVSTMYLKSDTCMVKLVHDTTQIHNGSMYVYAYSTLEARWCRRTFNIIFCHDNIYKSEKYVLY